MALFGTNVIGSTGKVNLTPSGLYLKKTDEPKDMTINFVNEEQEPFVKLSNAQNKYNEAESVLNSAKQETTKAQTNSDTADKNVSFAQKALDEAKNKTIIKTDDKGNTTEEPDNEAINSAQEAYDKAVEKQKEAQAALKEAQAKEQEAQEAYDTAKQELETAQKEYSQAPKEAENIKKAEEQERTTLSGITFDTGNDNYPQNGLQLSLEGRIKSTPESAKDMKISLRNKDKNLITNVFDSKKKGIQLGEMNSGSMFTGH